VQVAGGTVVGCAGRRVWSLGVRGVLRRIDERPISKIEPPIVVACLCRTKTTTTRLLAKKAGPVEFLRYRTLHSEAPVDSSMSD
jgi:hypothetical protein